MNWKYKLLSYVFSGFFCLIIGGLLMNKCSCGGNDIVKKASAIVGSNQYSDTTKTKLQIPDISFQETGKKAVRKVKIKGKEVNADSSKMLMQSVDSSFAKMQNEGISVVCTDTLTSDNGDTLISSFDLTAGLFRISRAKLTPIDNIQVTKYVFGTKEPKWYETRTFGIVTGVVLTLLVGGTVYHFTGK